MCTTVARLLLGGRGTRGRRPSGLLCACCCSLVTAFTTATATATVTVAATHLPPTPSTSHHLGYMLVTMWRSDICVCVCIYVCVAGHGTRVLHVCTRLCTSCSAIDSYCAMVRPPTTQGSRTARRAPPTWPQLQPILVNSSRRLHCQRPAPRPLPS
jgi:hypothetical protein